MPLLLHGLYFSSCLQVPPLASLSGPWLRIFKPANPFLLKVPLVMVFIATVESKLRQQICILFSPKWQEKNHENQIYWDYLISSFYNLSCHLIPETTLAHFCRSYPLSVKCGHFTALENVVQAGFLLLFCLLSLCFWAKRACFLPLSPKGSFCHPLFCLHFTSWGWWVRGFPCGAQRKKPVANGRAPFHLQQDLLI